jgi:hypothetical protein
MLTLELAVRLLFRLGFFKSSELAVLPSITRLTAGDDRLLVNVETAAAGMQDFHRFLLTRRRCGTPAREL